MGDRLRHRGPDEEGHHRDEHVGMAHRRLSIIDLAGGKQPMAALGGRVRLVFNGEIYNFRDVAASLRGTPWEPRGSSDTEVLLAAYLAWGRECLERLNGMFAFVIYDARTDTAFAARDRFGEKPLYVHETENRITFASEPKALFGSGLSAPALDPDALYSYFTLGYVVGPRSIFRDVSRLGPGEACVVDSEGLRRWRYWSPPEPSATIEDPEEAVERSLDLLRDSVRLRLVSDVPIGFFLSGGVDSSLVVAAAADVSEGPLETFSIGFDEARYDERPHARAVSRRFGTRHHEFVLRPRAVEVLERLAWHLDEPFADQAALPTFFLSELTRQHVTVALSGDGGDELFAGYDVYRGHLLSERLRRLPGPILEAAARGLGTLARWDDPRRERWHRLARNLRDARLPVSDRFLAKQETVLRHDVLERSLAISLGAAARRHEHERFQGLLATRGSALQAMAAWQSAVSLVDDMLVKVDRMSMAHSLEVRAPLLDHRMAELSASIPFAVKMLGNQTKYVLRKALERYFPAEFAWRRKQGFVVPLGSWFRGQLQEHARQVLTSPDAFVRQIFLPAALEDILRDSSDLGRSGHSIWALLMFETWARVHGIRPDALADVPPAA
jgi:asparagine synthase (glutamine-hydrolysing)